MMRFLPVVIISLLVVSFGIPTFAETTVKRGDCITEEKCSFIFSLDTDQIATITTARLTPIDFVDVIITDSDGNIVKEVTLQKYKSNTVPKQLPGEYIVEFVQFSENFTYNIGITITDWFPGEETPIETKIPDWIKNNAGWWADGTLDDSSFVQGIQFLIKENIIVIDDLSESSDSSDSTIPDWIKNNAKWWSEGTINETDFVNGIKYLIEHGIINVS